jgi:hypothetical protein
VKLTKAADLAAEWGMEEDELHRRRRSNGWPCVRFSRFDVRFTDEQIAQIVAQHTERPDVNAGRHLVTVTGQTARSARRT